VLRVAAVLLVDRAPLAEPTTGPLLNSLTHPQIPNQQKIASDDDLKSAFEGSLEIKTTVYGVNVGAGAQYTLDKSSSTDSVYITALASKVQNNPLALPSQFPPMTDESLAILRTKGRDSFFNLYGTHFVFGFRMGGFLSYTFQYQSNEQITKSQIALQLNAEKNMNSTSASLEYKEQMAKKNVNIKSSVRTNAYLPEKYCGDLVVTEEFNPDDTRNCILEWLKYPPEAAYGVYTVPFEYHPIFQQNLPPWESAPDASLSDAEVDENFRASGLLRMRLNQIKAGLGSYPLKEDRFYGIVSNTVETAEARVNELLTALRTSTITSTQQWQNLYKAAKGPVDLASKQANFVPKGMYCVSLVLGDCVNPACFWPPKAGLLSFTDYAQDSQRAATRSLFTAIHNTQPQ